MRALVSVQADPKGWRLHCHVCHEEEVVDNNKQAKQFHYNHKKAHAEEQHGLVASQRDLV